MVDRRFPPDRKSWYLFSGQADSARDILSTIASSLITLTSVVFSFVPTSAPLCRVWGSDGAPAAEIRSTILLADERTAHQDPAFGIRQLVDIAERALSPGVNDPTTAVQALDQIHELMRHLTAEPLGTWVLVDRDGTTRVIIPEASWDALVHLAFDEIRDHGSTQIQIATRMRSALQDLMTVTPSQRQQALREQLALLEASVHQSSGKTRDRFIGANGSERSVGTDLSIASRERS